MAMPAGIKRTLWRLVVLAFLAVTTMGLWLPPILIHATEKDYHFPEVSIDATVLRNGDLVLEEHRTFDFRNGDFTYAYYTIDDPQDHVREFTIHELVDGREIPVEPDWATHSIVTDGFQAQWSFVANDEERTWVFRYRAACAVDVWSDTAHLYWRFIGAGWEKPTSHAVVTVHLPPRSERSVTRRSTCVPEDVAAPATGVPLQRGEVRAWGHGPLNGEVTFVDPQTIRLEVRDVPPASYVEGSLVFPPESVPSALRVDEPALDRIVRQERIWADQANAVRDRHETERRWVFLLLLGLPTLMVLLVLVARLRDRIPEVPRFIEDPPEPDAVQAALLWSAWRGTLSPRNAYRAQILRLVRLGAIEMRAEGPVTDPKDLTLHKRMEAVDLPTGADRDFLLLLFGSGADAVDEISIARPKPRPSGGAPASRYREWWDGVRSRSTDVIRRIQKGDARLESTSAFLVTGAAAGYGIWTAVWGLGGPIGWWLVPVALVCLIAALRAIPARVERSIRERIARLGAFRRYLSHFSDLPNAPALAVVIWEECLEWAVALGVAEEVEGQVRALIPVEEISSPMPGGSGGLDGMRLVRVLSVATPVLVAHSMASASSGSTSGGFGSSSSSGGFSSGGFSGGGGGGGGGTGGGAG